MPRPTPYRATLARAPRGLSRRERTPAPKPVRIAVVRQARRAARTTALRDCGHRCVYCAGTLAPGEVTLDHVYPRSRGGPSNAGNLVAACRRCNRLKGDLLPFEFFAMNPWAGVNFVRWARCAHRALKRGARRAVSLAMAA